MKSASESSGASDESLTPMAQSLFGALRPSVRLESLGDQARSQRNRAISVRVVWDEEEDTTVELNETAIREGAGLSPALLDGATDQIAAKRDEAPPYSRFQLGSAGVTARGSSLAGSWLSPPAPAPSERPFAAPRGRRAASLVVTFIAGLTLGALLLQGRGATLVRWVKERTRPALLANSPMTVQPMAPAAPSRPLAASPPPNDTAPKSPEPTATTPSTAAPVPAGLDEHTDKPSRRHRRNVVREPEMDLTMPDLPER